MNGLNQLMILNLFFMISGGLLLSESQKAFANIPAAYLACEGAPEGSRCALPGPQYGVCVRDTLCVDIVETTVNECVLCVDGCWADQDGASCIRPWTGEEGICETQDRCTDPPATSFEECRRCVDIDQANSPTPSSMNMTQSEGCDTPSSKISQKIEQIFVLIFWLGALLIARQKTFKKSRL